MISFSGNFRTVTQPHGGLAYLLNYEIFTAGNNNNFTVSNNMKNFSGEMIFQTFDDMLDFLKSKHPGGDKANGG